MPYIGNWLKMKTRKCFTWDMRQEFSTRDNGPFCLFALIIGNDQKVSESTQVFVKEFSNIVYKIGNNKRKIKNFMFLLHYVWAIE